VIVYQEQVMQIASVMGGYSLGEADILRRAMGKKKKEVMEAEAQRFIERAEAKSIKAKEARKVFELMAYFAGYGFNKSHSAAYALVAYHTAWLKAHYPVHFMAALLTTEKANTDKLARYINECREMGIEVQPPDVNSSGLDFTVEGEKIRFGMSAIKNVGESAIRSILEGRREHGRYRSMHELCAAVDARLVNKRVLEALVQSGALDSLGARRSQLAAVIDGALEYGQKQRADREAGQSSLFGGGLSSDADAADAMRQLPDLPEWDEKTLLAHEKATLGFYVSGHPLESYRDLLGDFATHTTAALREAPSGSQVALGGIIAELRRRKSKKGAWWASMQLEDLEGQIEALVFPKAYEACQDELQTDRAAMVTGRVESDEDRVRLIAESVCPLDQLRERQAEAVQVRVDAAVLDEETVEQLRKTVSAHPGPARLYIEVDHPGIYQLTLRAESALGVRASRELTRALESVVGPNRVRFRTKAMI
jgi:DNA polymerase-3 subunit alpha